MPPGWTLQLLNPLQASCVQLACHNLEHSLERSKYEWQGSTRHNLLQRPTEIVCQHDQAFIKPLQDQDLGTDWENSPYWQDCLAWSNSLSNSSIRCPRMTSSCMSLRSIPRSQSILFRPPVPWQLTAEFDQSISPVPSLVSPSAKRCIKSAKLIPRTFSWWL